MSKKTVKLLLIFYRVSFLVKYFLKGKKTHFWYSFPQEKWNAMAFTLLLANTATVSRYYKRFTFLSTCLLFKAQLANRRRATTVGGWNEKRFTIFNLPYLVELKKIKLFRIPFLFWIWTIANIMLQTTFSLHTCVFIEDYFCKTLIWKIIYNFDCIHLGFLLI